MSALHPPGRPSPVRADCIARLEQGPATTRDIVDATGHSEHSVWAVCDRLRKAGDPSAKNWVKRKSPSAPKPVEERRMTARQSLQMLHQLWRKAA